MTRSYTKITRTIVHSVKKLSLSGMSSRGIANHYGISKETVKRILDGERDHVKDDTPSISEKHPYPDVPRSGIVDSSWTSRCRECGGKVIRGKACYLCYIRRLKARAHDE